MAGKDMKTMKITVGFYEDKKRDPFKRVTKMFEMVARETVTAMPISYQSFINEDGKIIHEITAYTDDQSRETIIDLYNMEVYSKAWDYLYTDELRGRVTE